MKLFVILILVARVIPSSLLARDTHQYPFVANSNQVIEPFLTTCSFSTITDKQEAHARRFPENTFPREAWSYVSKILADRAREVHWAGKSITDTINIGQSWREEGQYAAQDGLDTIMDKIVLVIVYSGRLSSGSDREPEWELSDCILHAATDVFERRQDSGRMRFIGEDDQESLSFCITHSIK